jgi:hypothetical protein
MQLLKLVVLDISIETCTMHGIGIVLVGDWAVLTRTGVPRGNHAFSHDASMVRSGAVIVCMVSGKTPTTDLPQRAIIFIVVGRVLIALEAVWKGSGGLGPLALLAR